MDGCFFSPIAKLLVELDILCLPRPPTDKLWTWALRVAFLSVPAPSAHGAKLCLVSMVDLGRRAADFCFGC